MASSSAAHTGASTPGPASSSAATGASTPGPGIASRESIMVGQWNMGLPTAESFARSIEDVLEDAAGNIASMAGQCHIIVLNELHPVHQGRVDTALTKVARHLCILGFQSGDALAWRRSM